MARLSIGRRVTEVTELWHDRLDGDRAFPATSPVRLFSDVSHRAPDSGLHNLDIYYRQF